MLRGDKEQRSLFHVQKGWGKSKKPLFVRDHTTNINLTEMEEKLKFWPKKELDTTLIIYQDQLQFLNEFYWHVWARGKAQTIIHNPLLKA